jgi:lipopolysaccharide/colanic/teichoic acid biosynthesis glycosyltransferase
MTYHDDSATQLSDPPEVNYELDLELGSLTNLVEMLSPASIFELSIDKAGNRTLRYQIAKRTIDMIFAWALLVILSPIILTTLLVLTITTRGKPFFRQIRMGEGGEPFVMYKFRTMKLDAEALCDDVTNEMDGPVFKNRSDSRITRIGRWLRKTSIDEMPQLINVLSGDMSLVGPRPPIPEEVLEYDPLQKRRLSVKPGLTCLWQVSGRSNTQFEDWMKMDLWYVDHQNLTNDLLLLMKTPWAVISGKGAY